MPHAIVVGAQNSSFPSENEEKFNHSTVRGVVIGYVSRLLMSHDSILHVSIIELQCKVTGETRKGFPKMLLEKSYLVCVNRGARVPRASDRDFCFVLHVNFYARRRLLNTLTS